VNSSKNHHQNVKIKFSLPLLNRQKLMKMSSSSSLRIFFGLALFLLVVLCLAESFPVEEEQQANPGELVRNKRYYPYGGYYGEAGFRTGLKLFRHFRRLPQQRLLCPISPGDLQTNCVPELR
jgi:hypothetical protein